MSVSLENLLLAVGRRLGSGENPAVAEGYVTQVANQRDQFRDALRLTHRDQHWSRGWVIFTSATNADNVWAGVPTTGNIQPGVSAYTRSSGVTLFADLPADLTVGDKYQVHVYQPSRLLEELNTAITGVSPEIRKDIIEESLTVEASTYRYTVPSSMENVHDVLLQVDAGSDSAPYWRVPRNQWKVETDRTGTSVVRHLQFQGQPPVVGNEIRLIGEAPLSPLTRLTDTLPVEANSPARDLILWGAVLELLQQEVRGAGYLSTDAFERLAKTAELQYEKLRGRHGYARATIRRSTPNTRPMRMI